MLTMLQEGRIVRFRCHTGHALSASSLLHQTTEIVEQKLWDGVRALDETVMLLNSLGERLVRAGDTQSAEQCFDKAREAHERAHAIREVAKQGEELSAEELKAAASAEVARQAWP